MKGKHLKKLILDFLDGDLSEEGRQRLEKECRENPVAAEERESFEAVIGLLRQSRKQDAPPGFTEKVMARIGRRPVSRRQRIAGWITTDLDISLHWAWKWSLVSVLIVVMGGGIFWHYARIHQLQSRVARLEDQLLSRAVPMRFFFHHPTARSVHIAGTFNDWQVSEEFRMAAIDGKGIWSITVMLDPGEYEYMFVVDGSEWVSDPTAPVVRSDGFGHKNSILEVVSEI